MIEDTLTTKETIDNKIIDIAQAIALTEGGGKINYNSKGALGEIGAFQFMPNTWKNWAGKWLKDPNAQPTEANQNKVAYKQIEEWKNKGFTPAQIFSAWNAGEGKPNAYKENWKGINKGVQFDTPKYTENGMNNLQKIIQNRVIKENKKRQLTQQMEELKVKEPTGKVGVLDVVKEMGNMLTQSEQKFGETIADATIAGEGWAGKLMRVFSPVGYKKASEARGEFEAARQSQENLNEINQKLANRIIEYKKQGKDTSNLEQIYKNNTGQVFNIEEIAPSIKKSGKQIFGEGAGVAMDIISAGSYGSEAMPLLEKSGGSTAKAFIQGFVSKLPQNFLIGAGFNIADKMQQDAKIQEIAESGLEGGMFNVFFSGLMNGLSKTAQYKDLNKMDKYYQQAVDQYLKGLNLTKGQAEDVERYIPQLLDEKWWGTKKSIFEKALKGQTLNEKEYQQLGELQGIVDTSDLITKIDDKMKSFLRPDGSIISTEKSRFEKLGNLKDDIMSYQTMMDWEKTKDVNWIYKEGTKTQDLRELAQKYGNFIKDYTQTAEGKKEVKFVDLMLRDLIAQKEPEYAKINKVYKVNRQLTETLGENLDSQSRKWGIGIKEKLTGIIGILTGVARGDVPTAIATTAGLLGTEKLLTSTFWNTMRATRKVQFLNKLTDLSRIELVNTIMWLSRQTEKNVIEKWINQ